MKQKLLATGLALATILSVSAVAHAQVVRDVTVNQNSSNVTIPAQSSVMGQRVLFRVDNPTSNVINFNVPELGISYGVAPESERTFFLDMGKVAQPQVAYTITDPNGNQLASGTLNNGLGASTDVASLDQIINYSTAYSAPSKPEPVYNDRPVSYSSGSGTVRGYW